MKGNVIPIGLKRPSKGKHSEKPTHKSDWFQIMKADGTGGPRGSYPYKPPCVLQNVEVKRY